jgi:hypothetical protein
VIERAPTNDLPPVNRRGGWRPSLSICCISDAPLDRIAAAIAPLRPFADEVVIAVDARINPHLAAAHCAFADRVVRLPFAPPVERALAWLHSECSGDWILRIDSDEIVSASLAERVIELTLARDVMQYWIPRRWLFPDRSMYLTEWPWLPDYQLRLVRNEPSLLRFPGTVHSSVECLGPACFLREPIYHLDCVIRSEQDRAAKVRAYNRLRHDQRMPRHGSLPLSEGFYLPEQWPAPRKAAVPQADREMLAPEAGDRFLAKRSPATQESVRLATREEVDRLWSQRQLAADAYHASLRITEPSLNIAVGEVRTLDVDVINRSTDKWGWGDHAVPPIHLSYRVQSEDGQHICDGPRTPMPAPLSPGSSIRVPMLLFAPQSPGNYLFGVDLVHEHVRWFGQTVDVAVRVRVVGRVGAVPTLPDTPVIEADAL